MAVIAIVTVVAVLVAVVVAVPATVVVTVPVSRSAPAGHLALALAAARTTPARPGLALVSLL